jgi:hypothetical protein
MKSRRAAPVNSFIGVNYIPDNPKMATPPTYWLKRLYDFDSDLVVLPSRYVPFAYVLARRARLSAPLTDRAIVDTVKQPDTVMCMALGLVPVSLIYRTGPTWSIDNILQSLKARDIWAHGGAEQVVDHMDESDASGRAKIKADIRDDMWNRSGDAWRSYQARTGQRTKLNRVQPRKARTGRRTQTVPSGSTAGSGLVLATA